MKALIAGGAGFVGLNIAEALLAAGAQVCTLDRQPLPPRAAAAQAGQRDAWRHVEADVTDPAALALIFDERVDLLVLGAAVTAGADRERRDPQSVLRVNLLAQVAMLEAARRAGVGRVLLLSSAAAYGRSAFGVESVSEDAPLQPTALYGISKASAEQVCQRLAEVWSMDLITLRLSAIFGPWERPTGVRDTLSPLWQIFDAAQRGQPALLARPGLRDWTWAADVGSAVRAVALAPTLRHRVYNLSSGQSWSALAWGEALAQQLTALLPGPRPESGSGAGRSWVCRLAQAGEVPTIDLHADADRAPLGVDRLRDDLGWQATVGLSESVVALQAWVGSHPGAATNGEIRCD